MAMHDALGRHQCDIEIVDAGRQGSYHKHPVLKNSSVEQSGGSDTTTGKSFEAGEMALKIVGASQRLVRNRNHLGPKTPPYGVRRA